MNKKEGVRYEWLLLLSVILIGIIVFLSFVIHSLSGRGIKTESIIIEKTPETEQIKVLNSEFFENCCYQNNIEYPNGIIFKDIVCKRRNRANTGTYFNAKGKKIDLKKCSEIELYSFVEVVKD